MFHKYRISRDNLLSTVGDVTPEGQYVTKIKDPKKLLSASFKSLSNGRVQICG